MEKKAIGIGNSIFDSRIEKGCYYVDKTLLVKDLLDSKATVTLITRPRRFGKTLNMFMLKSFFEDNTRLEYDNKSKRHLFDGLKITQAGEGYMQHFGQYPVIMMSLKGAKQPTWEMSYSALRGYIYDEYSRHAYLLKQGLLDDGEAVQFRQILDKSASQEDFQIAIRLLTGYLYKYCQKKTVILIDEYDVPLESAWSNGYYIEMTGFIRSVFEAALKDNPYLEFAVMTGCLRISKESIFTGLNNPAMVSIISSRYAEHFGFTQAEVDEMLAYYGLMSKREEIREWYDGYLFGQTEVYNPWSVINRVSDLNAYIDSYPEPYWINTSGNMIIRELVEKVVDENVQNDLETLMAGGTIEKMINENITYSDAYDKVDNLWNFLFFTGYLKKVGEIFINSRRHFVLAIPNIEVSTIYQDQIRAWFERAVKTNNYTQALVTALVAGDIVGVQQTLSEALMKSISYFDAAESFYHGFLTALLVSTSHYDVKSNRETGSGRSDIFLCPRTRQLPVIIIETKIANSFDTLEAKCTEALKQIETRRYADEFIADGYRQILKYGIAFYKKECLLEVSH
ncbi:MAG: ATP-binding protein [Dysgonamonadaceae bacterium]|nr:ATP-binding protein [Dysgonamonadaceae bacterium]